MPCAVICGIIRKGSEQSICLIWPVFVNDTPEDWNNGVLDDYAGQALTAGRDTLMVNPLDTDPVSHGGAFRFQNGPVTCRIPFDREDILIIDTEQADR